LAKIDWTQDKEEDDKVVVEEEEEGYWHFRSSVELGCVCVFVNLANTLGSLFNIFDSFELQFYFCSCLFSFAVNSLSTFSQFSM